MALGLLTRSRATLDHLLSAGRPFTRQAGTVNVETVVLTLFLVSDNSRSELYQQVSRSRREVAGFVRAAIWSRVRDPARADQVIST
jgi:hypothetical protein